MDADTLEKIRREEADLTQKLEALRMILRAYGADAPIAALSAAPTIVAPTIEVPNGPVAAATLTPKTGREKVSLDRFGDYGRSVVQAAIDECRSHLGRPIASRDMVTLVERRGIEVRGNDKVNAISALLARSIDLKPNGRKGWTLSEEYHENERRLAAKLLGEENAPQDFDEILGADAGKTDAPTSPFHGINL
ncbi:hypothetical protein [Novosphingobium sp. LASN5T]|uniref:hypothetical protein n=1 Tax=Novosphingobium sp. LASN5T TaxID=2491021 RepID=UPI000F5F3022|nr:hypothetical protein [Novosphingobium sp. LASN5T]RQW44104.1 hypothetical protein EH199_10245 [Novosphingobium sp. LASN5T]